MTEAAQRYFKLYYQLDRMIDDEKDNTSEADVVREKLNAAYEEMTDKERDLLDIVGKKEYK